MKTQIDDKKAEIYLDNYLGVMRRMEECELITGALDAIQDDIGEFKGHEASQIMTRIDGEYNRLMHLLDNLKVQGDYRVMAIELDIADEPEIYHFFVPMDWDESDLLTHLDYLDRLTSEV